MAGGTACGVTGKSKQQRGREVPRLFCGPQGQQLQLQRPPSLIDDPLRQQAPQQPRPQPPAGLTCALYRMSPRRRM